VTSLGPGASDGNASGPAMRELLRRLYPICRSITGDGVRRTLALLQEVIPIEVHEVPTGTRVFDWTIPKEWNIRDAYVKNARGERVIDFKRHNLHVVSYSVPVRAAMSLAELRPHLHTLPGQPDLIPYRTSYYKEDWGFCLAHRQLQALPEGDYEVCIDSSLEPGHLTYGELLVEGASQQEVLISCHCCHPSLADDNLSGLVVAAFLARQLARISPRYSYRFLFIPGTIGAITWLSLNEERTNAIRHGLVLTCLGDRGNFTYKKSRCGEADIDVAVRHVLKHSAREHRIVDFSPYGYDERQYCSPGFDLPVGCLMRSHHGEFAQYHTSADDLDFVDAASLAESLEKLLAVVHVLEHDGTYVNLNPKCEPQLGKRGLYSATGGANIKQLELAMMWVLNLSDGTSSLLAIAERSGLPFALISDAATMLMQHQLLSPVRPDTMPTQPASRAAQ
jgi:aminopeptidase-like protein